MDGGDIDEKPDKELVLHIKKRCAYLDDDNLCTVYENMQKPSVCSL